MSMNRTLQQEIDRLTPENQAQVGARAGALIFEELFLRAMRKGLQRTQADIGEEMQTGQDAVSRLEDRCNIVVATLDRYIKAAGGQVSIIAEFRNRPSVELNFDELVRDLKVE